MAYNKKIQPTAKASADLGVSSHEHNKEIMKMTDAVTTTVKSNFSGPHLLAAALFSCNVASLEKENEGLGFGEFFQDILSYSMACVISSVAALEAYANELFINHKKYFPKIEERIIIKFWELYEQKTILQKYEFALFINGSAKLDSSKSPYQDVAALVKLRNALVHFKPEWDDQQEIHRKVSSSLSGRFTPTKFMGEHEPLFPKRWSSAGCTKWAVMSCIEFIAQFDDIAGYESKIGKLASKLQIE